MTSTQTTIPATAVRAMSALATLNTLRQAAGKAPLKAWKASRKELDKAIEKAHGEVPVGSKLPNVDPAKVIAKINEQPAKPVLDADRNIVKLSQSDRKAGWDAQPPRKGIELKSVAIAKTISPEAQKIMAANKAQGKKPSKGERARYDWDAAEAKAKAGTLPTPPDMSAPTHKHYVGKLNEVATLARTGKLDELRKYKVSDRDNGSPALVKRYQALAIVALKAKG